MMQTENNNGFAAFLGALVVAGGLLYVSGWYIAWDDFIATKKSLYIGHGIAVEFNNKYYGILFTSRFFDSPVVSWIIGLIAASTFSAGLNALLEESEEDDEEEALQKSEDK